MKITAASSHGPFTNQPAVNAGARRLFRDYEKSTFQNKPAYRYIRAADKLPPLGSESKQALVKLFDPTGSWSWFISEYDPETHEAFGLVDGFEREYGYISMSELVAFRGRFGLPIERDLHWTPRPLSDC